MTIPQQANTVTPGSPQVDEALCTLCGLCAETCPCNAVQIKVEDLVFSCQDGCVSDCQDDVDDSYLCEEICPTGAIVCSFDIVIDASQAPPNKDKNVC